MDSAECVSVSAGARIDPKRCTHCKAAPRSRPIKQATAAEREGIPLHLGVNIDYLGASSVLFFEPPNPNQPFRAK